MLRIPKVEDTTVESRRNGNIESPHLRKRLGEKTT